MTPERFQKILAREQGKFDGRPLKMHDGREAVLVRTWKRQTAWIYYVRFPDGSEKTALRSHFQYVTSDGRPL